MSSQKPYDSLILGSGQSGTPLASHLRSLNQTVCLIESSHIGGCCVNEGCTPTKTMVASARIAYLTSRAKDYGVSTGDVEIDMRKVRQRKRDIVDSFRGGGEKRLRNAGVDVLMGTASFRGPKEVEVKLNGGGYRTVTAETIYINVGCRPSRPDISGLDQVDPARVLDSTSIQELDVVPEHLVVLGGGVVAVEFAQLFRRFGSHVSIIQRRRGLLGQDDDPDIALCLEEILKEDGIQLLLGASASTISPSSDPEYPLAVHATSVTSVGTSSSSFPELPASHILLATGRVPNTETLNLPAAGIMTLPSGHILASPTLVTNVPGVYVMGDVKGGPGFTHVSYDDFRIIRDNLAHGIAVRTTEDRAPFIPSVIYTDPQVAHIGPKWGALPSLYRNRRLVSYSMPGSWIARGLETDETRGLMKAVVDEESGKIISFSAIGTEAGEVMAVVQMAMQGGLGWEALRDAVWAHPSWSESLNNLWGGERKVLKF